MWGWDRNIRPKDHTNNGFFFLLTTKCLILYCKNIIKTSRKFWLDWVATLWRHFNITMTSRIDVRLACGWLFSFPTCCYRGEINRIHHGTEKSQPEGPPFQWETRLAEFPTERWTRGLGFFWNHWTPMIDSFSQIPILNLATVWYGTV